MILKDIEFEHKKIWFKGEALCETDYGGVRKEAFNGGGTILVEETRCIKIASVNILEVAGKKNDFTLSPEWIAQNEDWMLIAINEGEVWDEELSEEDIARAAAEEHHPEDTEDPDVWT